MGVSSHQRVVALLEAPEEDYSWSHQDLWFLVRGATTQDLPVTSVLHLAFVVDEKEPIELLLKHFSASIVRELAVRGATKGLKDQSHPFKRFTAMPNSMQPD